MTTKSKQGHHIATAMRNTSERNRHKNASTIVRPSKLERLSASNRPAEHFIARSEAVGASAIGAFALGALSIGAVAIGALAIRHLAIGNARVHSLKIGKLDVVQLRVKELAVSETLVSPGKQG